MKTERRHELQHNALADWIGWVTVKSEQQIARLQPYRQAILGGAVVALALLAAYWYVSDRSLKEQAAGWEIYLAGAEQLRQGQPDGLQKLVDEAPTIDAAVWARLRLGDFYLMTGIEQMFRDRAAGNESLNKAVDQYTIAAASDDSLVRERATLGLARAYETQSNLEKARAQYQSLVGSSYYGSVAQARLDALQRDGVKRFYDWFATRNTQPIGGFEGPGTPGIRPPSTLDMPPLGDGGSLGDVLGGQGSLGSSLGSETTATTPPSESDGTTSSPPASGEANDVPAQPPSSGAETPAADSAAGSAAGDPAAPPAP